MSNKLKPLYVQVADKLADQLKEGTSPLQKPIRDNGQPAFIKPVNAVTGKGYSAMNALNLALKGYEDPRWLSFDAASFAKMPVKEGERGTLISFPKTSDIEAIRTPEGAKIKGEDGKTQTRAVEFEKPQPGTAFLFNAAQLTDPTPLEEFLAKQSEGETLSPVEKAIKLIADSGAVIVHGGAEAFYDRAKDEIHLPEQSAFENETKYLQAAIHQLIHWSGHESRENRPMEGKFGSADYGKEELRAAIASMLIGAELKIGHNFGQHAAYSGNWVNMLKKQPYEFNKAVTDAQKAASRLLGFGQVREEKKSSVNNLTLTKGEEIAYNNTTYKVLDQKGKTFEMEKADTSEKFKITPKSGVFAKLIDARNNPPAKELEIAETEQRTSKIGR